MVRTSSYLEEEAEADPLIVLVVSPLQRILCLVHAGVRHVETNPLPEGTGDGVGGVDPAVRVQHVLGTLTIRYNTCALGVLWYLKSFVQIAKCAQVINWLATSFYVLLGVGITWAHCSQ